MLIEQPSVWLRWLYPKALWRMDRHEKAVYLTFDDGPIPEATPWILDVLQRYGVKATFFMVGDNARKYPELHQRVVNEGHRIGNHTHNHIDAPQSVCLALAQVPHCHVGPRHPRLFQVAHGRRCAPECEALCPQRVHHHLPRLTEKY